MQDLGRITVFFTTSPGRKTSPPVEQKRVGLTFTTRGLWGIRMIKVTGLSVIQPKPNHETTPAERKTYTCTSVAWGKVEEKRKKNPKTEKID